MKTFILLALVALSLQTTLFRSSSQTFAGSSYQSKSAQEKMNLLAAKIWKDRSSGSWHGAADMAQMFIQDMNTSFDTKADELPYQYFDTTLRKKLIHTVGTVGRAKWVSVGSHPYTGCFKSGAKHLLVRLSVAKKPDQSAMAPGMGVKFLRDGMRSGNFVCMFSLRGQKSFNFFKNDFTNHVPKIADPNFGEKLLLNAFRKASPMPEFVGLSDIASFDESGKREFRPVFPYELILKPASGLRSRFSDAFTENWIDHLKSVTPKNTPVLYEVYAKSKPGDLSPQKIAEIQLTSELTSSKFGDQHLFFQHQRFDDDQALRRDFTY